MSIFQFFRLYFLGKIRTVAFTRNLAAAATMLFLTAVIFAYFSVFAFYLDVIIAEGFGIEDTIGFINSHLLFFFAAEFFYRFFLQKLPVAELDYFLHLPVKRGSIIRFLLSRSFISLLNVFVLLILLPFTINVVWPVHGGFAACSWLAAIVLTSWALHWVMLVFKKQLGSRMWGLAVLVALYTLSFGAQYMGWYNIGTLIQPFFDAALHSVFPLLAMLTACIAGYIWAYQYYRKRAYAEEISPENRQKILTAGAGFLSRFGKAGEFADLEWRLIIRHKKSRGYLFISVLFLFYGLLFYPGFNDIENGTFARHFSLFIGLFITGMFMMQYGQLYLSWNSANFDFYLSRYKGLQALVEGKNLLFVLSCTICFILSVPYAWFSREIVAIHLAAAVFNIGINMHIVAWIASWKPKPMDINKGGMFNYEGIGAAQFLMMIPLIGLPYLIYLPIAGYAGHATGLIVLTAIGFTGILFYKPLTRLTVQKIIRNRYQISASFRQEI